MKKFSLFKSKKQEEQMHELANLYFDSLKKKRERVSLKEKDSLTMIDRYIERVNYAYEQLSIFRRKIINNDFFYNDYDLWWVQYCSKTYYKKERSAAIKQFLKEFNNYV